jgi:hypothetical protein
MSALPRCKAKATESMKRRLGSGRLHTLCSSRAQGCRRGSVALVMTAHVDLPKAP